MVPELRALLESFPNHKDSNNAELREAYAILARKADALAGEVVAVRFKADTLNRWYIVRMEQDTAEVYGTGRAELVKEVAFPFMFGKTWDELPPQDSCTLALLTDTRFRSYGFVVHYGGSFCEVYKCRLVSL